VCFLRPCLLVLLAGPGVIFLRAGALQASFVLLHPCLHILLAMYSEVTACMHQLLCTAVSSAQISSSHSIIMHICLTLHVSFFLYIACLLTCLHAVLACMRHMCTAACSDQISSLVPLHHYICTFALPCMSNVSNKSGSEVRGVYIHKEHQQQHHQLQLKHNSHTDSRSKLHYL